MTSYGQFFKKARERRGFTQAALAQIVGFESAQLISNIERGYARYPIRRMPKLIRALKLEMEPVVCLILREESRRLHRIFKIKNPVELTNQVNPNE